MIIQYGLMIDQKESGHPYLVRERAVNYPCDRLNDPEAIADMLTSCFKLDEMAEEYLFLITMDAAGHVKGVFELAHGTAFEAPVGLRELFVRIILTGTCFAICHNHPSGLAIPSKEDKRVAGQIKAGADLLKIPMLDFIVLGHGCNYSFSRNNLL